MQIRRIAAFDAYMTESSLLTKRQNRLRQIFQRQGSCREAVFDQT